MACAWELQIQFQPCLLWPLINVKCGEIYTRNSVVAILSSFLKLRLHFSVGVLVITHCSRTGRKRHHFQSLVQGAVEDRPARLILMTPALAERRRGSPTAALTLYTSRDTGQQTTTPQPHLPEPKLWLGITAQEELRQKGQEFKDSLVCIL